MTDDFVLYTQQTLSIITANIYQNVLCGILPFLILKQPQPHEVDFEWFGMISVEALLINIEVLKKKNPILQLKWQIWTDSTNSKAEEKWK